MKHVYRTLMIVGIVWCVMILFLTIIAAVSGNAAASPLILVLSFLILEIPGIVLILVGHVKTRERAPRGAVAEKSRVAETRREEQPAKVAAKPRKARPAKKAKAKKKKKK